ncbi:MAG: oligosaccharide flippase family protein [Kordiimonadaceae bacterium]|nr:oligosaccharide flippase family protein [Kordiimonadaceae bacterium]
MNNASETEPQSFSAKVFIGAAYMVGTRFFVRLLGLFSVTILARVLTPEDFGVFATAALVLAFFALIKDVGFSESIIKSENISKADLDTLWTLSFSLSVCTSILLIVFSGVIADFLKEPKLVDVLHLMAAVPILDCCYSPASSLNVKNFRFGQEFILKSTDKLVRVLAVIGLALTLKSYWALVYGALLASIFGAIVSQIAYPYFPKITLVNRSKFTSFAIFAYFRGLARYVANSVDELVVRASENNALFGVYHVSKDLTRVLVIELIAPVGYALLPALVKLGRDTERFSLALQNTISVYLLATVAISFGIIAVSDDLVLLLLGPQWGEAAYFLSLVAIGGACTSLGEINQNIFISRDGAKQAAAFATARAITFAISCLLAGLFWGPAAVAMAFSASSVAILLIELLYIFKDIGLGIFGFKYLVRPIIAGGVMLTTLQYLPDVTMLPLMVALVLKASTGALIYGVSIVLLWWACGKPKGGEQTLIERLPSPIKKILL